MFPATGATDPEEKEEQGIPQAVDSRLEFDGTELKLKNNELKEVDFVHKLNENMGVETYCAHCNTRVYHMRQGCPSEECKAFRILRGDNSVTVNVRLTPRKRKGGTDGEQQPSTSDS